MNIVNLMTCMIRTSLLKENALSAQLESLVIQIVQKAAQIANVIIWSDNNAFYKLACHNWCTMFR